jgi:ABC-2 type transport system ATP-binding protein
VTAVIETENLTKTYGAHRGIVDVDLSVNEGEAFGFLGPNGAGKTTTIRTLLDHIRPTSGRATIFGIVTTENPVAIHRRLGYLPGEFTLYDKLTGGQTIEYFANLRGGIDKAYQQDLIARLEVDPSRKFREYSKGNKQKIGLIIALQHRPDLLLLDEPTSGLDPLMEEQFREVIRDEKRRGDRTVLLSSHILAEVEALCDRITIIRDGRAVETGTLADMRHLTRTNIQAELAGPPDGLTTLAGVHDLRTEGDRVVFDVDTDALDPALRTLVKVGVRTLVSQPPTLEELFLRQYRGGER